MRAVRKVKGAERVADKVAPVNLHGTIWAVGNGSNETTLLQSGSNIFQFITSFSRSSNKKISTTFDIFLDPGMFNSGSGKLGKIGQIFFRLPKACQNILYFSSLPTNLFFTLTSLGLAANH